MFDRLGIYGPKLGIGRTGRNVASANLLVSASGCVADIELMLGIGEV